MDATTKFDTLVVGGLPVILNYLERLGMAAAIDEVVPWEGDVPLGMLVEIMVINRLLNPQALFRIGEWAEKAGVCDYYQLKPEQLNDDRLGRVLERVHQYREEIQAALTLRAIRVFDLDVGQIHFDLTSVELFGAYENQTPEGTEPAGPLPAYGHTKSGRSDVKQILLGMSVTRDGGVPLVFQPHDGNTAESTTHLQNLRELRTILPKSDFVYIADTKLDTEENLLAIHAGKGKFLCGGAFLAHWQETFIRNRKKLRPIDYHPQSQEKLPEDERDQYQAFELDERLEGDVDGRRVVLNYRLLFVWSEGKARQQSQTRERHLEKIRVEMAQIEKNLNKYSLTSREAIVRRLEILKARYAEGKMLDYEIGGRAGRFTLTWKINPHKLARAKQLEGVFLLKTNLTRKESPLAQTLATYKEQSQVERRFHHVKGPLAVAPMFLEKPERMAGLLGVVVWSLMILALMERQVRQQLKGKPMYGLYPENRPSPSPTGISVLQAFSLLCIVIVTHKGQTTRRLTEPNEVQRKLLQLLGISPGVMQTFKRRCGM